MQKTFKQIGDLWASFSPSQKGTYTVIVLLLIVAPIIFSYKGGGSDYESMLGDRLLDSNELRNVQDALIRAGKGGARIDGMQVMVPVGRTEEFLKALAEGKGLPPDINDMVLEGMSSSGIWESAAQRKNTLDENRKKQAAKEIEQWKDVRSAVVNWSSNNSRGLFSNGNKLTGTVTVRMHGDRELRPAEYHSIQTLVANRVQGLSPADVAVTNSATGVTYNPSENDADDRYFLTLNKEENSLRQKIENALSHIQNVGVTVKVVLDKQEGSTQRKFTYDPKTVTTFKESNTVTKNSRENRPSGEPGAQGNRPLQIRDGAGIANQKDSETNQSTQRNVVGYDQKLSSEGGLRPVSSTASISIPESYYRELLKQEGVEPPAEDASEEDKSGYRAKILAKGTEEHPKVLAAVKQFITMPPGEDPTQYIAIQSTTSLEPEPIPGPSMFETAGKFINTYSRPVALGLFAIAALFMLNRSLKGVPAAPPVDIEAILNPPQPEGPVVPVREPEPPPPPSRREDVQLLVRDNPEMAAAVLKNWLSS